MSADDITSIDNWQSGHQIHRQHLRRPSAASHIWQPRHQIHLQHRHRLSAASHNWQPGHQTHQQQRRRLSAASHIGQPGHQIHQQHRRRLQQPPSSAAWTPDTSTAPAPPFSNFAHLAAWTPNASTAPAPSSAASHIWQPGHQIDGWSMPGELPSPTSRSGILMTAGPGRTILPPHRREAECG